MHEVRPDKTTERAIPGNISDFINSLKVLSRGDKAVLRRNAGNTLARSRNALGLFYRIVPHGIAGGRYEEIFFLVATLFGYNEVPHSGDFGTTMRKVKQFTQSNSPNSLDRRMAILLDSDFDWVEHSLNGGGEIAYRLRQCVKLAAGHHVGVDWPALLNDLLWWMHSDKKARKRWARSYFGHQNLEEINTSEIKEEEKNVD
ncbi:MAG: type I-E CRISPR-associated protein Cse2/CasB [bacterium]